MFFGTLGIFHKRSGLINTGGITTASFSLSGSAGTILVLGENTVPIPLSLTESQSTILGIGGNNVTVPFNAHGSNGTTNLVLGNGIVHVPFQGIGGAGSTQLLIGKNNVDVPVDINPPTGTGRYPSNLYIIDQVLDSITNLPVVGAVVLLYRNNTLVGQCITDAQGIYKFENLEPGNYKVEIYTSNAANKQTVDLGNLASSRIGNIVFTNIVQPATSPVNSGGQTTNVNITSSGTNYSKYLPPVITTPSGFLATTTVDPITGSITSCTPLVNGTDTSITTDIYLTYDVDQPVNFQGQVTGYIPAQVTNAQINDLYERLIATYSSFDGSANSLMMGAQFEWHPTPPGIWGGKTSAAIYEVYNSPILSGVFNSRFIKDLAFYPVGTLTVRVGGSFAALANCGAFSITHHASIAEPWITLYMWDVQVITVSCEATEWGVYYPVGANWRAGAGVFGSYNDYVQARNTNPPTFTTINKVTVPSTLGELQAALDNAVQLLMFAAGDIWLSMVALAEVYNNAVATTFANSPTVDDNIPITFGNDTSDPTLDPVNSYRSMVYGDNKNGSRSWINDDKAILLSLGENPVSLGQRLYPFLKLSEDGPGYVPTSRNTGIPNPDYIPNYMTSAEFNQVKGYLGPKFLPEQALPSGAMAALQSIDSQYNTTFAPNISSVGAVVFDSIWQLGEALGDITSGRNPSKQWQDLQEQLSGFSTGDAPEWLKGKSFVVPDKTFDSPYAYRHSWDQTTGAYNITKIQFK